MTHTKYSRTRKEIHKGMARHPGERKSPLMRREQSDKARGKVIESVTPIKAIIHAAPKVEQKFYDIPAKPEKKGFLRRLFNRKTGG